MHFAYSIIAAAVLSAAAMTSTPEQRIAEPPELVFARGESEIALKRDILLSIFAGEPFDWAADLDAGTITFTSATRVVTAPVQVIGTYNSLDGTFLWGWDHPSIPNPRRAHAGIARRFGEAHDLPLYTTRMVEVTEEQAWRFTATALYLAGAQGAYRGPAGTTMIFMTFGDLTVSRR